MLMVSPVKRKCLRKEKKKRVEYFGREPVKLTTLGAKDGQPDGAKDGHAETGPSEVVLPTGKSVFDDLTSSLYFARTSRLCIWA